MICENRFSDEISNGWSWEKEKKKISLRILKIENTCILIFFIETIWCVEWYEMIIIERVKNIKVDTIE